MSISNEYYWPIVMEPQIASSESPWLTSGCQRNVGDITDDELYNTSSNLKIVASLIIGVVSASLMLR
jgi:hypothetical protein